MNPYEKMHRRQSLVPGFSMNSSAEYELSEEYLNLQRARCLIGQDIVIVSHMSRYMSVIS
jgi:hypothetical protein